MSSGHNAGERLDAVAPHSTTAAHRTAPALSSGAACVSQAAACVSPTAACVSPLDARRASFSPSQPRVAVPASEPTASKIVPQAWRALEMSNALKTFFQGWMQEVCRMTLTLPPLQHQLLVNAFDLLLLQPSRPLQPCLRSAAARATPPHAPLVSRAPSQPRAAV